MLVDAHHFARIDADDLERIQAIALYFGRHDLDVDARPLVVERLANGLLARVLGNDLLRLRLLRVLLGWRSAHHHSEHRERQLRVILRESLSLLPQQSAFETLVFFLQQEHELAVLVTLALELAHVRGELRLESLKSLFKRRRSHTWTNVEARSTCQAQRTRRSGFRRRLLVAGDAREQLR